jgi:hypothetical protein
MNFSKNIENNNKTNLLQEKDKWKNIMVIKWITLEALKDNLHLKEEIKAILVQLQEMISINLDLKLILMIQLLQTI